MNIKQKIDIKQKIGDVITRGLRALGINTPGLMDYFLFGPGQSTLPGARIHEGNALGVTTVYQCVRVITDAIGQLPLAIYKEVAEGAQKADDHPLYRLFHTAPNPLMPPSVFKKCMQGHLCLWGNAYAEIERNGRGQVTALWPLRPDSMRLQLFNRKIFYYYTTPDGTERQLRDVLHLRGLSSDGLVGYSPIAIHREKMGLTNAALEYRARFFANNAQPGGALRTQKQLGDVAYKRLEKFWEEKHGGLSNAGRVAILEEGLEWQSIGMPAQDMQYLEGAEFEKADIAGIFGVPPYKIGLLKPGTVSFASVEQQAQDMVSDCVAPYVVNWEECLNLALLTPAEQKIFFCKFSLNALLRGDSESRARFYTQLFNIGVFSQNDILKLEDRNTIGTLGDRRYVPMNYVPVDMVDKVIEGKTAPSQDSIDVTPAKPAQLSNGAAH
jgi:HK97 family phage portal protein